MSNLSRLVRANALRNPDGVAVVYGEARVSYRDLFARIERLAGYLRNQGVGRGDRVALLMKNSAAFIELALAISHVGGVLVPMNYRLSADEVDFMLGDSGAKLLFCDQELACWQPACPIVAIVTPEATQDASRLATGDGDTRMEPLVPGDLMRILYTSGTTDRPKGVMHTYANFYAKSADQIVELGLTAASRLLVVGPLYHVGAFDLPGMAVLWTGGMLSIQRDFDAAAALAMIERERLDCTWLAPVMTASLLTAQAAAPRDVSSLSWAIGGGERTPETRIRDFARAFSGARYIDAYGLTETCGGDTLMPAGCELAKIGSVGRPLPQVDIAILDDDGGPVAPGETGEICLRGAKVTAGYWNAPEKTAACFFGDWLRTGDIGHLDSDGFLCITDRKKDMIISGGENIASSEVERAINELPEVQDVAVIGIPDARWGERPVACIVLVPGLDLTEQQVQDHCRNRLAPFKSPDRVIFSPSLPRNASGKLLKRELRDRLAGDGC